MFFWSPAIHHEGKLSFVQADAVVSSPIAVGVDLVQQLVDGLMESDVDEGKIFEPQCVQAAPNSISFSLFGGRPLRFGI